MKTMQTEEAPGPAETNGVARRDIADDVPTTETSETSGKPTAAGSRRGHSWLSHASLRARAGIVAAVIAGVIIAVFAGQNFGPVRVFFLAWTVSPPLFLVCLISVGLGILLGIVFSLVRWRE